MEIFVFKTSVKKSKNINEVGPLLAAVPEIINWNFDLEDCDHILRTESVDISPGFIEKLLQTAGYDCTELQ